MSSAYWEAEPTGSWDLFELYEVTAFWGRLAEAEEVARYLRGIV